MPSAALDTEYDVLVIGSGAAGLAAAVTAAWHGQKVIVVEKEPVFGGATAWSGGARAYDQYIAFGFVGSGRHCGIPVLLLEQGSTFLSAVSLSARA